MDELLIRQAPHSPEAEQAVLGSMLIDADCVKVIGRERMIIFHFLIFIYLV